MGRIRSLVSKSRREDGSGLVLTLMVLMVLSVLAVSLATVTIGSYRLTAKNRDSVSVYYVAEASLNETYEEIKSLVTDTYQLDVNQDTYFSMVENGMDEANGRTMNDFSSQFSENPTATIQIQKISDGNPREYTLTSEGKIGNTSRTLTKNFTVGYQEKDSGGGLPYIPTDAAMVVRNEIEISGGGKIIGDVHLDAVKSGSFQYNVENGVSGKTIYNPDAKPDVITYPDYFKWYPSLYKTFENRADSLPWEDYENYVNNMPLLSDQVSFKTHSNLTLSGGDPPTTFNLEENLSIDTIEINSNRVLNLDPNGKKIKLVLNNLIVNGSINVIGEGSVEIFIKNQFTVNYGYVNKNSTNEQMQIYYYGQSPLILGGGLEMNSNLFIDRADISIGAKFNGILSSKGNNISFDGGSSVGFLYIAPFATVNIQSQASGIVVSKNGKVTNGGSLTYKKADILSNGSESSTGGDPEADLIISEPVIETSND
ncbi:hypothetical protein BKP56_10205 [Marinilactibacillus sp. 15R]|uniref:pilus assembly PilX N-terminal domain-containing protein n=1 Tax=Marinilactibacillus sp. 15R TaxID=1911586 RepID=UPI000909B130|nr:pilus assembly PilX N-terminal domain-containing protein [Marinilactibacillus sp. 15R]API89606.1 hypothetical protein BKP56_10205 [Marinilactibacillus sp. 15R]